MDPWNPILNSSISRQIDLEAAHAAIRDRVSLAIIVVISASLIAGWVVGL